MLFGDEQHNKGVLVTKDWIINVSFYDQNMAEGPGTKVYRCADATVQSKANSAIVKKGHGCSPMVTGWLSIP